MSNSQEVMETWSQGLVVMASFIERHLQPRLPSDTRPVWRWAHSPTMSSAMLSHPRASRDLGVLESFRLQLTRTSHILSPDWTRSTTVSHVRSGDEGEVKL